MDGAVKEAGAGGVFADPDQLDGGPFDWDGGAPPLAGDYVERAIGPARLVDVGAAPLHLRDKASFARAAPAWVMLQAVVGGRPVYDDGRGAEIALGPSALVIRRADEAAAMRSDRFARVVTLALPQHLLVPRFADEAALDHCAPQTDALPPQRLLHGLIVALAEADGAPWLASSDAMVDGVGGLVSMIAAQAPRPAPELSELAAERAAEVLRCLRRNFANPLLTPSAVAEELNISARYVHKLMQLTGRSFREELVAFRLEAARHAFAANRRSRRTIADIAGSVGFSDLSQFNRHFRAAFGMTPKAARKLDQANGYDPTTAGGARPLSIPARPG